MIGMQGSFFFFTSLPETRHKTSLYLKFLHYFAFSRRIGLTSLKRGKYFQWSFLVALSVKCSTFFHLGEGMHGLPRVPKDFPVQK